MGTLADLTGDAANLENLKAFLEAPDTLAFEKNGDFQYIVDAISSTINKGTQVHGEFDQHSLRELATQIDTEVERALDPEASREENEKTSKQQGFWTQFHKTFLDSNAPKPLAIWFETVGYPTTEGGGSSGTPTTGMVPTRKQMSPLLAAAVFRVLHADRVELDKHSPYIQQGGAPAAGASHTNTAHGAPPDLVFTRHLKSNMDYAIRSSLTQVAFSR